MKKIVFSLALVGILAGTALAQQAGNSNSQQRQTMTPEQKAQKMTQRMTQELTLTADQATKINNINLQKEQQLATIKQKYAGNTSGQSPQEVTERKQARQTWETQAKQILTPAQWTTYETNKKQHHQQHGNKQQQNTPAPQN